MRQDWAAALPREKLDLFKHIENTWEVCYAMLSISLDEGLRLLSRRSSLDAHQCAANSAEFLQCLAVQLLSMLDAMEEHGRHFGTLPLVVPLDPFFFRGKAAQGAASWNSLLHKVLLSDGSRFFHKLRTLAGIIEEIASAFFDSAEGLVEGSLAQPDAGWEELECLHYDLNTCLRETIVILKSFLRALPDEELKPFQSKFEGARRRVSLRARSGLTRTPT